MSMTELHPDWLISYYALRRDKFSLPEGEEVATEGEWSKGEKQEKMIKMIILMLFKFIFEAFWDKIPRITLENILVFRLVAQPKCAYRTLVESTVPKIMIND